VARAPHQLFKCSEQAPPKIAGALRARSRSSGERGIRSGPGAREERSAEPALGAGRLSLNCLRARRLPQSREEQSLVNPTIEDRDAQLDAFDDYVTPLKTGFAGELSGRQVVGHTGLSPFAAVHYIAASMPRPPDGHNANGRKVGAQATHFARVCFVFMNI